jgi:cytoskeletal protein CcmA (bactofilin family)
METWKLVGDNNNRHSYYSTVGHYHIKNGLSVEGNTIFGSNKSNHVYINSRLTIENGLDVSGNTIISDDIEFDGDYNAGLYLYVAGDTTIGSNTSNSILINGTATMVDGLKLDDGNAFLGGDLYVNGNIYGKGLYDT